MMLLYVLKLKVRTLVHRYGADLRVADAVIVTWFRHLFWLPVHHTW